MTGTSLDGLDVVLGCIKGRGLAMRASCCGTVSRPLGDLAGELGVLASGEPVEAVRYVRAGRQLGGLYAQTLAELCQLFLPESAKLDFVVAHGQTIAHFPSDGLSWQLFDPWPIVRGLGVPVCYDLRQADLIGGGQGAPITPLSDWILYRRPDRDRVVVNLGGICNVTYLPGGCSVDQIQAEDIGPCNLLIDGAVRFAFPDLRYDDGGALAAGGTCCGVLHEMICQESAFFRRPRPRTAGREEFGFASVQQMLARAGVVGRDAVAAATEAVAALIADYVAALPGGVEVVLAGGGANNGFLVDTIRRKLSDHAQVILSDQVNIPIAAREALGMAVLGALTQDGLPVTLPQVTGSSSPGLAGVWAYP